MEKNKRSRLPQLSLKEALGQEEYKQYSVDDLFYEAEIRNLRIYIKLPSICTTSHISDIYHQSNKVDLSNYHTREPHSSNGFAWLKSSPLPTKLDLDRQDANPDLEFSGNRIEFINTEANSEMFSRVWGDLRQISTMTFTEYRTNSSPAIISLNVSKEFGISDSTVERIVTIAPWISLQDAYKEGMLFVSTEDLHGLHSLSPNTDDVKGTDHVSESSLLKLVLGMAIDAYGYDYTANKSPIPTAIQDSLALLGIDISDDTIRKALKNAASKYPPQNRLKSPPSKKSSKTPSKKTES